MVIQSPLEKWSGNLYQPISHQHCSYPRQKKKKKTTPSLSHSFMPVKPPWQSVAKAHKLATLNNLPPKPVSQASTSTNNQSVEITPTPKPLLSVWFNLKWGRAPPATHIHYANPSIAIPKSLATHMHGANSSLRHHYPQPIDHFHQPVCHRRATVPTNEVWRSPRLSTETEPKPPRWPVDFGPSLKR